MGDVVVTGLDQVLRGLDGLADDVTDLDAVDVLARQGALLASRYAPVDTGRLSHGISGQASLGRAVITTSRDTVRYAGAMERRYRYMGRASDELENDAPDAFADSINDATRRRGLT